MEASASVIVAIISIELHAGQARDIIPAGIYASVGICGIVSAV